MGADAHWRTSKASFLSFRCAFVGYLDPLFWQGCVPLPYGTFLPLAGFTRYANRIAYAPPLFMEKKSTYRGDKIAHFPAVFRFWGNILCF